MNEECEHDWQFQDDSFDHEFGIEIIVYDECMTCGATRPHEPREQDFDDE